MIHPSAVVDPEAEIDPTAVVEALAVVEGPCVVGPRTRIQPHAVLTGRVTLGADNVVGYGAVIGAPPQDLGYRPDAASFVRIGDGNVIREHCTIHRGTKEGTATVVGSHNFLMAGAHLGHNVSLGDRVILANNVLLGGYVSVGDRAFLGGGAVVHQWTRIGRLALLQGLAAVSKDVPPFTAAARANSVVSLNAVGLRRAAWPAAARLDAKAAFRLLYRAGLNARQAQAEAAQRPWDPAVAEFWEFVASSKRGICPYARWADLKGAGEAGTPDEG